MKYLLFLYLVFYLPLISDEKLGGQEIVAQLDQNLYLNEGLTYAKLSIKKGHHQTNFWNVKIFKRGDDVLYTFEVTHRQPVAKFLSIKRGQRLIYYNVVSGKIFQIEQMEKKDQVLHTSFAYLDLSNYLYEENYTPLEVDRKKTENSDSIVVKMVPNSIPYYKYLELVVDNTNYTPSKIDFTSPEGLLVKTLKLKYGKLKVKDSSSVSEKSALTKLEMTDTSSGSTSVLEFITWDKNVNPDRIFYEMKSMYEK